MTKKKRDKGILDYINDIKKMKENQEIGRAHV